MIVNIYLWNEIFHDYHVVLYVILKGPPGTYQNKLVAFLTINNHLMFFIKNKMLSKKSIKFGLLEFDLSCNFWEAHKGSFQLCPILSNYFLLAPKNLLSSAKKIDLRQDICISYFTRNHFSESEFINNSSIKTSSFEMNIEPRPTLYN